MYLAEVFEFELFRYRALADDIIWFDALQRHIYLLAFCNLLPWHNNVKTATEVKQPQPWYNACFITSLHNFPPPILSLAYVADQIYSVTRSCSNYFFSISVGSHIVYTMRSYMIVLAVLAFGESFWSQISQIVKSSWHHQEPVNLFKLLLWSVMRWKLHWHYLLGLPAMI